MFSPTGKTLGKYSFIDGFLHYNLIFKTAVGFMDGWIRILSTATLEDLPQNKYKTHLGYKVSSQPISRIVFSPDLSSLAFSDVEMGVGFLRKESVRLKEPTVDEQYTDGVKMRLEWVFVGRAKSHSKEVICMNISGPIITYANIFKKPSCSLPL